MPAARQIVHDGRVYTLRDLCARSGVSANTARSRIRSGWDPYRACTEVVQETECIVELHGERKSIRAWCAELGISSRTVGTRMHRGWDPVEALTTAAGAKPRSPDVTIDGVTRTAAQWRAVTGVTQHAYYQRLHFGMTPAEALTKPYKSRRRWTADDDRRLRDLWGRGTGIDALAETLNRRHGAVRRRLWILKLGPLYQAQGVWRVSELADALGETFDSIMRAAARLGIKPRRYKSPHTERANGRSAKWRHYALTLEQAQSISDHIRDRRASDSPTVQRKEAAPIAAKTTAGNVDAIGAPWPRRRRGTKRRMAWQVGTQ